MESIGSLEATRFDQCNSSEEAQDEVADMRSKYIESLSQNVRQSHGNRGRADPANVGEVQGGTDRPDSRGFHPEALVSATTLLGY